MLEEDLDNASVEEVDATALLKENLAKAMSIVAFAELRREQTLQLDRFFQWDAKRRQTLIALSTRRRKLVSYEYAQQRDVLLEKVIAAHT